MSSQYQADLYVEYILHKKLKPTQKKMKGWSASFFNCFNVNGKYEQERVNEWERGKKSLFEYVNETKPALSLY